MLLAYPIVWPGLDKFDFLAGILNKMAGIARYSYHRNFYKVVSLAFWYQKIRFFVSY
jgi:hypothetical protein